MFPSLSKATSATALATGFCLASRSSRHDVLRKVDMERSLPLHHAFELKVVFRDVQLGRQEGPRVATRIESTTRISSIFRERIHSFDTISLFFVSENRVIMIQRSGNSPRNSPRDGMSGSRRSYRHQCSVCHVWMAYMSTSRS